MTALHRHHRLSARQFERDPRDTSTLKLLRDALHAGTLRQGSHFSQATGLMLEFDQNTLANMTAALEWVCKKIPPAQDTPEVRKQIADAMVVCAKSGRRTYVDFQDVGTKRMAEITKPQRSWWFGWFK